MKKDEKMSIEDMTAYMRIVPERKASYAEFPDTMNDEIKEYLGKQGIDSVLLEGGGTLNDAALSAGIVNEICAFIAPKIFGGAGAKTPVSGIGVAHPAEAVMLTLRQMETIGDDLMLRYSVD